MTDRIPGAPDGVRIRDHVADLAVYVPGASHGVPEGVPVVKLSSNEGAEGPTPAALAALAAEAADLNRYPESAALQEALAAAHGLAPDQVAVSPGADMSIAYLAAAFLGPGDDVVFAWPAFVSYLLTAQKQRANAIRVPLVDDTHDLDAMLAAITPQTSLVYVCNPNNPTGTAVGFPELQEFVAAVPPETCLVIDEAYCEYSTLDDPDLTTGLLEERENLVLLRTFSKVYGLAGLRVGFALCGSEEIPAAVNRVRQPFFCSAAAQAAGVEALRHPEALAERVSRNRDGRAQVMSGLEQLGLAPAASEANFCWVGLPVGAGEEPAEVEERVLRELATRGVLVRGGSGLGRAGWLRITFGSHDENSRALEALAAAVA